MRLPLIKQHLPLNAFWDSIHFNPISFKLTLQRLSFTFDKLTLQRLSFTCDWPAD